MTIDNFTLAPRTPRVSPGARVFSDTDDKFSMRFDQRGEYPYLCSVHPMTTATIVVQ